MHGVALFDADRAILTIHNFMFNDGRAWSLPFLLSFLSVVSHPIVLKLRHVLEVLAGLFLD